MGMTKQKPYWANEFTRQIAEEIYALTDPVGEGFSESVLDMAKEGYSRREAKEQLAWEIEVYFGGIHAELFSRANPIERLVLEDFDAMQIDFGQIAEGFLADYPPSEASCNDSASCNKRSKTAKKAKGRRTR